MRDSGEAPEERHGVVIVGASLGGLRCAEALRLRGYAGPVTLIGAEAELPYDRPPLSKQVLRGERGFDDLLLRAPADYAPLVLDLRLGVRATGVDPAGGTVSCSDGREVPFDWLVLATGSTPRRLPGFEGAGVHYLRDWADSLALRQAMQAGAAVAVIGGGFIGGEVASSARALGLEVTLVEGAEAPLAPVLGPEVGALMAGLHRAAGVDLRCNTTATLLRQGVLGLSDGTEVAAGAVVVGVGATPVVDYLAGSGLPVDNGILCDPDCRVRGQARIFALGDVARLDHPLYGSLRIEHWTNATEQAEVVAANIADPGARAVSAAVPYFWSDQFGARLQFLGRRAPGSRFALLDGSPEAGSFVAGYQVEDRTTAVLCFNQPRAVPGWRRRFAAEIAARLAPAPAPAAAG